MCSLNISWTITDCNMNSKSYISLRTLFFGFSLVFPEFCQHLFLESFFFFLIVFGKKKGVAYPTVPGSVVIKTGLFRLTWLRESPKMFNLPPEFYNIQPDNLFKQNVSADLVDRRHNTNCKRYCKMFGQGIHFPLFHHNINVLMYVSSFHVISTKWDIGLVFRHN